MNRALAVVLILAAILITGIVSWVVGFFCGVAMPELDFTQDKSELIKFQEAANAEIVRLQRELDDAEAKNADAMSMISALKNSLEESQVHISRLKQRLLPFIVYEGPGHPEETLSHKVDPNEIKP